MKVKFSITREGISIFTVKAFIFDQPYYVSVCKSYFRFGTGCDFKSYLGDK